MSIKIVNDGLNVVSLTLSCIGVIMMKVKWFYCGDGSRRFMIFAGIGIFFIHVTWSRLLAMKNHDRLSWCPCDLQEVQWGYQLRHIFSVTGRLT